jgi:hypothetical protein
VSLRMMLDQSQPSIIQSRAIQPSLQPSQSYPSSTVFALPTQVLLRVGPGIAAASNEAFKLIIQLISLVSLTSVEQKQQLMIMDLGPLLQHVQVDNASLLRHVPGLSSLGYHPGVQKLLRDRLLPQVSEKQRAACACACVCAHVHVFNVHT